MSKVIAGIATQCAYIPSTLVTRLLVDTSVLIKWFHSSERRSWRPLCHARVA